MGVRFSCSFEHSRPRRDTLNAREQAVYDALYAGMASYRKRIALPRGASVAIVGKLFNKVKSDNPELFFVRALNTLSTMGGMAHAAEPVYRFDAATAQRTLEAIECATGDVVRRMRGTSDLQAVRTAHDWLAGHFAYRDGQLDYAHEAAGPLAFGVGVCDGVSKAFKYLCDRCGIACAVVAGTSHSGEHALRRAGARAITQEGPHAWNLVALRDRSGAAQWFHLDVTYDSRSAGGEVLHDFFCLSDAAIAADRTPDADPPLPRCPRSLADYPDISMFLR